VSPGKDGSGDTIPNRAHRVSALEGREPNKPQNFYRPFSGLDQRNAPPTPGTPYPAQYPPDFLLVNATGVPVFRTRYGRSVLPSGLSVGLSGSGSVFALPL